jgi:hypothetical protein
MRSNFFRLASVAVTFDALYGAIFIGSDLFAYLSCFMTIIFPKFHSSEKN